MWVFVEKGIQGSEGPASKYMAIKTAGPAPAGHTVFPLNFYGHSLALYKPAIQIDR